MFISVQMFVNKQNTSWDFNVFDRWWVSLVSIACEPQSAPCRNAVFRAWAGEGRW